MGYSVAVVGAKRAGAGIWRGAFTALGVARSTALTEAMPITPAPLLNRAAPARITASTPGTVPDAGLH